jgi:hypothetical protein
MDCPVWARESRIIRYFRRLRPARARRPFARQSHHGAAGTNRDDDLAVSCSAQQRTVKLEQLVRHGLEVQPGDRSTGGFADVEFNFDGKTLMVLGKHRNVYVQADMPGTFYQLIDDLRDKFHKPLPGADLLAENVNDVLMEGVTDVKDLGAGVIGGKVCDHLAFRTAELDWQIWIAQGDQPYPCRYVITSTKSDQAPQFAVDIRDFKAGGTMDFAFTPPEGAKKIDIGELKAMRDLGDLPENFKIGE